MSLANLSVAYKRMRGERDFMRVDRDEAVIMHHTLSEHCNGLMDYLAAGLLEGNVAALEWLRMEAELHRETLAQRRASGRAEA